jgi:hypothetical protein
MINKSNKLKYKTLFLDRNQLNKEKESLLNIIIMDSLFLEKPEMMVL